jgi:hypothetical protein
MSRLHQLIFSLVVATAAMTASAQPAFPPSPGSSPTTVPNSAAISPSLSVISPMSAAVTRTQSPVVFFRKLLAMTPGERNGALTNRSAVARARILAKVHEYLVMSPDERELRLRSTELRWYLTPLLQMSPADRQARLAQMPEDMRELAESRLEQWDILPPSLKEEFLANDTTLHYFAHVETAGNSAGDTAQTNLAAQFDQFFELTPGEKQQALRTLTGAERAEMEQTLEQFDQLPLAQRRLCVRNYARFAGMSAAERADFLKNADRWSKMSPQERQTWQDLVAHVPIWPVMPTPNAEKVPDIITPPSPGSAVQPHMATN